LHFAPERCFLPVFKQLLGSKYHTSEYNPSVPATHHYDIQKIDAPDHSFNMVICSHVLEHVPNDHAALQEIIRILKPGGRAFIQVPMWPSEKHPTYENPAIDDPRDRIIHFGQWDHLRNYGHDVLQTIQNAGFKKVERIHPLEYFKPEIVALNQLRNHGGVVDYTFVAYA
jgi:SAM-dependent methyltransferase